MVNFRARYLIPIKGMGDYLKDLDESGESMDSAKNDYVANFLVGYNALWFGAAGGGAAVIAMIK